MAMSSMRDAAAARALPFRMSNFRRMTFGAPWIRQDSLKKDCQLASQPAG